MVSLKQFLILGLTLGAPIAVASPGDIEARSSELNPDALPSKLRRSEDEVPVAKEPCTDETPLLGPPCDLVVDGGADKRSFELNPEALLKKREDPPDYNADTSPPPYEEEVKLSVKREDDEEPVAKEPCTDETPLLGPPCDLVVDGGADKRSSELNPDALPSKLKKREDPPPYDADVSPPPYSRKLSVKREDGEKPVIKECNDRTPLLHDEDCR